MANVEMAELRKVFLIAPDLARVRLEPVMLSRFRPVLRREGFSDLICNGVELICVKAKHHAVQNAVFGLRR